MKFKTSLRYRVSLAFTLLGLVVSLGLALVMYVLVIAMEQRLIAETLSTELEDYITRFRADSSAPPPASTNLRTYVVQPGRRNVPAALSRLLPGLHRLYLDGTEYYAKVRFDRGKHFIVLYAARQIHHRKNQFKLFLGIAVLVITLLSAFLGYWLAGRVIVPVTELASRVAGLRPEDHPSPLAADFPQDELGLLAHEFDAYSQRLSAFIEREQDFTANVSHELRTPLAVIEGASEILLAEHGVEQAIRAKIKRIARSASEMSELVSALLLLAREDRTEYSGTGCTASEVLQQLLKDLQPVAAHKPVELKLEIRSEAVLAVECTLLRVVLSNLLRNALHYTREGYVEVCLESDCVVISDTGTGMPKQDLHRIFDRFYTRASEGQGIGLSLVKRICERQGWQIGVDSDEGSGTTIQLSF